METIKFYVGEENKTIMETSSFKSSIFYHQYEKALSLFQRIWNAKDEEYYDNSNIIAFCGERGDGKTSCLRSVRHILQNANAWTDFPEFASFAQLDTVKLNESIYVLDILDPAYFDRTHNLVDLILGQMYSVVVEEENKEQCGHRPQGLYDEKYSKRKDLLAQFQKAKRCMSYLEADKRDLYDQYEELSVLAASVGLKKSIKDLFDKFLNYFKKKKLVISIDDLDLNMSEGDKMVEELRKYLCNDTCIILLSVKIDQLIRVVQNANKKAIHTSSISDANLYEMAVKYVNKLIPSSHRVTMPVIYSMADNAIEIYEGREATEPILKSDTVKDLVVKLIYRKTRFLFYNGRSISPIIPNNLRALRHLLSVLYPLHDADEDREKYFQNNKQTFKDYFFYTWTKALAEEDQSFIMSILDSMDDYSVNKAIVSHVHNRLSALNIPIENKLYKAITQNENRAENISVGDVLYVLRLARQVVVDFRTLSLIFFLKAYYSIRLFELYDEISVDAKTLFPEMADESVKIHMHDTLTERTNALQRFVNGSMFTYEQGSLLTTRKSKSARNIYRDIRAISSKKLYELIEDISKTKDTNSNSFVRKLHRCEYFALCTSMPLRSNNTQEISYDRTAIVPPYLGGIPETANYVEFDILALFTNLLNVKYAYKRFDLYDPTDKGTKIKFDFYDFASNCKDSLLNKMKKCSAEYKSEDKKYTFAKEGNDGYIDNLLYLLSDSAIRVSDIQDAIMDTLIANRDIKGIDDSVNSRKIAAAYKGIQNMGITLYPTKDKEQPYTLKFEFLNAVIDYLSKETTDKDVEFDKIYLIEDAASETNVEVQRENLTKWYGELFSNAESISSAKIREIIRKERPQIYKKGTSNNSQFWVSIFGQKKTYKTWLDILNALTKKYDVVTALEEI